MRRSLLLFALTISPLARAAEPDPLLTPEHRIAADDPGWRDLWAQAARRPDALATFEERRWFPIKKLPTVLQGEVRVSTAHGLSLHYLGSPERTVIFDDQGLLIREAKRETVPPADPRANAANGAMLHVLRFNFPALNEAFEVYGERRGTAWTIALIPRVESLRRTLGQITVNGEGDAVRRIEMRRSLTQRMEIIVAPPQPPAAFTADELHRFFR